MEVRSTHAEEGLIGKVIGPFLISQEVGRGGMGTVYKAQDRSLKRTVAVKVLAPELAQEPEQVKRFVHEARTAARLNHPNIVSVLTVGRQGDVYLFSMEYVEGHPLSHVLAEEGPMPVFRALGIVQQIAAALAEAHRHGVVHRDIKPQNIMLGPGDQVKVMDFGLAKVLTGTSRHTAAGMLTGTPAYMSPEQCQNQPVDGRTDIYALGVVLFEMLSGNPPFTGDDLAVMYQIVHTPMPRANQFPLGIPPALDALVAAMTAKSPAERLPSAEQLGQMLASLRANMLDASAAHRPAAEHGLGRFQPSRKQLGIGIAMIMALVIFGIVASRFVRSGETGTQRDRNLGAMGLSSLVSQSEQADMLAGSWILKKRRSSELYTFSGPPANEFQGIVGGIPVKGQYLINSQTTPMEIDLLALTPVNSPIRITLPIMRGILSVEQDELTMALADGGIADGGTGDIGNMVLEALKRIQEAPRPDSFEAREGRVVIVAQRQKS